MTYQEKLENDRKRWKKKVEDFKSSGLTATEFSKQNGISPHQFHYWKNKFSGKTKHVEKPPTPKPSPLIKVITAPPPLPQDLPDPQWLAALIKALV